MAAQPQRQQAHLLAHGHGLVQVDRLHARLGRPGQDLGGDAGQVLGADGGHEPGQEGGQLGGRPRRARVGPGGGAGQLPQVRGGPLVGAVLQEPGEEQVAGLEELQVLLGLVGVVGQEPVGLERQQRGRHDEELAGAPQVPVGAHVGDELVGDLGQGELGHVQAAAGDERQQQVEGPLELGQGDGEAGDAPRPARPGGLVPGVRPGSGAGAPDGAGRPDRHRQATPPRAMSSRARRR